jgi:uncharacterized protein (DUF2225 family)
MKKITLLILFLLAVQLVSAHDCHPQMVKCPIDNTEIKFCVYGGSAAYGNYTDFQQQIDLSDFYEQQIKSCPKCHYSGYLFDFTIDYNKDEKRKIKKILSKYDHIEIDDVKECEIAAELKEYIHENNDKIANCFLVGSYILKKNAKKAEYRKELQNKARSFFIKALKKQEYSNPIEITSITYLVAELYRRTGDFENAILYYDEVINSTQKSGWIEEMVFLQKELAVKKDAINTI